VLTTALGSVGCFNVEPAGFLKADRPFEWCDGGGRIALSRALKSLDDGVPYEFSLNRVFCCAGAQSGNASQAP